MGLEGSGEARVKAEEGGEVGRGQTTQNLWMVQSWDFIRGAVEAVGRIKQVRDIIGLKLIEDPLIG